jgi:hypothetical protein
MPEPEARDEARTETELTDDATALDGQRWSAGTRPTRLAQVLGLATWLECCGHRALGLSDLDSRDSAVRMGGRAVSARRRQVAVRLPLRRLVAAGCIAGLTVAVSGCGARAGGGDPMTSVLERAAAADASFGVRYSVHGRITDEDSSLRLRGYGQVEADQRRARIVVIYDKTRGETILDGHDEYGGGSFAALELFDAPSHVRWTKLDTSRFLHAGYIDRLCLPELPTKIASVLAASNPTIEKLGAARVRGRRTLRYRVTTTYGRVLDTLAGDEDASQCDRHDRAARFAAELWIDRHSLVRRMRLRYRRMDGKIDETRDITGYDRIVRVRVPTGPTVLDTTDAMLEIARSVAAGCPVAKDC